MMLLKGNKMKLILIFSWLMAMLSCSPQSSNVASHDDQMNKRPTVLVVQGDTIPKIEKSIEEWQSQLTDKEFYVLREKGTERAFSGDLWNHKGKGTYVCAGCQLPLFTSDTKFRSGTGWPSFWQPVQAEHILEEEDLSYGMRRVEVMCGRCEGHLGHVFPDGPEPTGLRYCINSVSLDFVDKNAMSSEEN